MLQLIEQIDNPIFEKLAYTIWEMDKTDLAALVAEFFQEENTFKRHFPAVEKVTESFLIGLRNLDILASNVRTGHVDKKREVEIWEFFHKLLQSRAFILSTIQAQGRYLKLTFLATLLVESSDQTDKEQVTTNDLKAQVKGRLLALFDDTEICRDGRVGVYLNILEYVTQLVRENSTPHTITMRLQLLLELVNLPLDNLSVDLNERVYDQQFSPLKPLIFSILETTAYAPRDDYFPLCADIIVSLCAKGYKLSDHDMGEDPSQSPLLRSAIRGGFYQFIHIYVGGKDGIRADGLQTQIYSYLHSFERRAANALTTCYYDEIWELPSFARHPNYKSNLWRCSETLVLAGTPIAGEPILALMENFVWKRKLYPELTEAQVTNLLSLAVDKEVAMRGVEEYCEIHKKNPQGWDQTTLKTMQRIFAAVRASSFTSATTVHTFGVYPNRTHYAYWPTPERMCVLTTLILAGCSFTGEAYHPVCHLRRLPLEILCMTFEILKYTYECGQGQKTQLSFLPPPRALPAAEVGGAAGADDCSETSRETGLETVLKTEPRP